MTKKLLGLMFLALLSMATLNASTVFISCTGAGGNPASGAGQPVVSNASFVCPSFTIPANQTLNSVTLEISNSFSNAQSGQTNTVDFTYTISGFNNTTSLSSSTSSNPSTGNHGGATDLGGITGQAPGTQCSTGASPLLIDCVENPLAMTGFTVTGSSSWVTGTLLAGGSDGFSVTEIYTYSPTISTPEPASLMMIGGALVGLALVSRRRKKA